MWGCQHAHSGIRRGNAAGGCHCTLGGLALQTVTPGEYRRGGGAPVHSRRRPTEHSDHRAQCDHDARPDGTILTFFGQKKAKRFNIFIRVLTSVIGLSLPAPSLYDTTNTE